MAVKRAASSGAARRISSGPISGAIDENEDTTRLRMHVLLDRSRARDAVPSPADRPRAGAAAPSRADPTARLHELALEDEQDLGALVPVDRKPGARLEAYELHLPAVRDRDVLHEHSRRHGRRPPGEVGDVHRQDRITLGHFLTPERAA